MNEPPFLTPAQRDAIAEALRHVEGLGGPGDLTVEKLGGGYSNLTALVRGRTRDVVVRMPPPGARHIKAGHDVIREARLLEKLHPAYPLAPRPLAIVEDEKLIGVPFFAMEHVPGRVLRHKPPQGVDLSPPVMRRLSERFVDALADLHVIDVEEAGLAGIGRPAGYVRRQVDGWRERYDKAKTDEVSDMERLSRWLDENVPTEASPAPAALVHNDFKYDNLVLDHDDVTTLRGVLDWELATVGDPLTDLGTSLAYWVEEGDDEAVRLLPLGLTYLPGNLTRVELVRRYEARSGRPAENLLFHVVLASFKVAVIAQQIYFRYVQGFTSDPRFAPLGFAVAVIGARAVRMIDAGGIEGR